VPGGAIPNANGYCHSNCNGYRHSNCGSFGDAYSDRNRYSYSDANGYSNSYCYIDSYANCYCNSYCYTDAYLHTETTPDAKRYAFAKAASDPAAAALACSAVWHNSTRRLRGDW
jgi:hypothetical protein